MEAQHKLRQERQHSIHPAEVWWMQPVGPPPDATGTVVSVYVMKSEPLGLGVDVDEISDKIQLRVAERGTVVKLGKFADEMWFRMSTDKQAERVHVRTNNVDIMNSTVTLRLN